MPGVAYVIGNLSIRKCNNFGGAFCVGWCIVRKVWPPHGASCAIVQPIFFCIAKGLKKIDIIIWMCIFLL